MSEPKAETAQVEPVTAQYVAGLLFAADVAHAEARWQTELAMRTDDMRERAKHRYAADRASKVEGAVRAVGEAVRPDGGGERGALDEVDELGADLAEERTKLQAVDAYLDALEATGPCVEAQVVIDRIRAETPGRTPEVEPVCRPGTPEQDA